ncbi:hypothetical protein [Loktanella sp. R86503]|uniref:hypothetical protein n=1 Tax=Loktanella sp. R86503 TaxID=3093847 RepID=UPI0036DDCF27
MADWGGLAESQSFQADTPELPTIAAPARSMGYGAHFQLSDPVPPPKTKNAAPSGKGTALKHSKGADLLKQHCHKQRSRATGLFVWDRASNSFQTFASMRGALA